MITSQGGYGVNGLILLSATSVGAVKDRIPEEGDISDK